MQEQEDKSSQEKNSGIKFNIKTLKSDIEEKSGEELFFNVQKESVPTKEIKLPPEEEQSEQISTTTVPETIPEEKKPTINPKIQAPQWGGLETIENTTEKTAKEPVIEKPKTWEPSSTKPIIKFEEQKAKHFTLPKIKPVYFILTIVIVIILSAYWLYQRIARRAPPSEIVITQTSPEPSAIPPAPTQIMVSATQTTTTTISTSTSKIILAPVIPTTSKSITTSTSAPKITTTPTTTKPAAAPKIAVRPATVTPTTEEPKSPKIYQPIEGTQKEITPTRAAPDIPWILGLQTIDTSLNDIDTDNFKTAWITSLKKNQKKAGTIWAMTFSVNSRKIPVDFVINYFINPTFIENKFAENFKASIGPNYEIVYYYTNTRKFPVLIFEINNDLTAIPFLRLWDKEDMLFNFQNIYYGVSSGKFTRKYMVTRNYGGVDYRIAFKDDDYKFLWSVYNNKLMISSTVSGFQILIDKLKALE